MKRREVKGAPSTDLLVCFPTRSHLTLMPKTICSPSRLSSSNNHRHSHHHRGKSIGGAGDGGLWSKRNQIGSELSEPTSPKVTCAGQIKARPKSRSCKNWRSVMEDIERLRNNNKILRKKSSWGNTMGFKKESMQFLTCLRSFKFDHLGCFGAFPNANVTSDDDDDNEGEGEDEDINHVKKLIGFGEYNDHDHEYNIDDDEDVDGSSRSAFSKWFAVLDENQHHASFSKQETENLKDDDEAQYPCVPPSNALLLMRCRSAPTKSLLEENEDDDEEDEDEEDNNNNNSDDDNDDDDDNDNNDDDRKKRESLMELMKYDEGDFYKLSCDIAKETWVVGGIKEHPISRTQSKKQCSTECLQQVKACLQ